jgi:putative ABC transport system permease protein
VTIRSRKVARDLIGNPARTILVVVAIAIGLTGLSTTLRSRAIFTANLADELAVANPSSATLLSEGADQAVVTAVASRDDVADAEGRIVVFVRIEVDDELRPLRLEIREDLAGSPIDRIRPEQGAWPPPSGTIVLERSSTKAAGLGVGDAATITDPTGASHELSVAATAHDSSIVSGELVDQVIFAYTTVGTWEQLGLPGGFNEIALTVGEPSLERDEIADVAASAAEEVMARGVPVLGIRVPPPGLHVLDNVISSLLLILGALGVMSLVLAGFLVFNTVSATVARQMPQIGVMKAIGASRRDVLVLYLAMVAAYGVMALLIAVPAGALAARYLTQQLGALLNIDINTFAVPAWVWLLEIGAGLVVPLAAALVPILSGTRATVAEVIRGGEGAGAFGTSRIDRALARVHGLPESLRYAARNTFRRPLRLLLTVGALSVAGAILITVLTLRSSLLTTVDSIAAYWQQDVTVDLQQPIPLEDLDALVRSAGADHVEGWMIATASVVRPDGQEATEQTTVFGVPPDSSFIDPTLMDGRWLAQTDEVPVVINVDVAANEPGVSIGDELVLRVGSTDTSWQVIGIATTQLVAPGEPRPAAPIAYVPYDELAAAVGGAGAANRLVVSGTAHDAAAQTALANAVDDELRDAGVGVQAVDTAFRMQEQVERLTTPILVLLTAMAVLFAIVGGLGLLGTMSLNVLERTSEFGVVRAVGATGRSVLSIVLVEGLTVAALAWLAGSLLAVPLGWVMGHAVGVSFIKVPLDFSFALIGVVVWLAMAAALAVIASWVPARNASRLSVRDAIAYE